MARVPAVGGRFWRGAEGGNSDHFCPGCGICQKIVPRHPWYFCWGCLELAEDYEGRRLVFESTGPLGGFGWRYADDPAASVAQCSAVVCLIRKREILVREARFGGVVAEPLHGMVLGGRAELGVVQLSRRQVPAPRTR